MPDSNLPDQDRSFSILPDPDRLEALAEYAAGAGHEINNPLATIIGRANLLLKDERDPPRRQMLMSIGAQAYRIRDMIGDTMLFARPPQPDLSDVRISEVLTAVTQKQTAELANERCRINVDCDDTILVRADTTQLAIVLSELLRNSREALRPGGGEIEISVTAKSGQAVIQVSDRGKGFTSIEQAHAFNPFFSGRQAGRGLGFGLPKCWRIIQQHEGQIEIASAPGGPTTVTVAWPLAQT